MNAPQITANGGTYLLEWEDEDIKVNVDRLDDRGHTTTGEVTVRYKPPQSPEFVHLHQARLNMTSTRERKGLANYLAERDSDIDWAGVIEQVCVKVLAQAREGEPVVRVGNLPINERPQYLSHPLLLAQQPNLIYGGPGAAKSTLAAMTILEAGLDALWLDFEWSQDEVNRLVARLKDGMGLDPSLDIPYRYCSLPLADDILAIQRMVVENHAQVVVVDSIGAACGGDPNDPGVILRYFAALRSLKVTSLSIDHQAKEAKGLPFGSIYKMNCARNAWEAVKGSWDSEHLSVGLHHRKINSGPLVKSLGFEFRYTPESIIPKRIDVRTIPELLESMSISDQIEAELLKGPQTPAELGTALGKTPAVISTTLSRHKARFVSMGGGKWGTKASGVGNG